MFEINDTFYSALLMMWNLEGQYIDIILLSLKVSLTALIISCVISLPLASYLSIKNFFGKSLIIIILNSFMALPPVVVGLFLYLLLSWQGVLSSYEILYTPTAMIIAQTIIIIPIVAALSKESIDMYFNKYKDYLLSLKISNYKIMKTLLWESRYNLIVNGLAGLGRAFSEVGAVIIVGGNIAELTRVMTTAIVLETSKGNFALAMSLGLTLISISLLLNFSVYFIKKTDELD